MKELKKLDTAMHKYSAGIKKIPTKMGTWFKLPESILRKNPVTRKYFDSVDIAAQHYRGNVERYQADYNRVMRLLSDSMVVSGASSRFGLPVKAAQKKLAALEATHKKLQAEGKRLEADRFYEKNLKD